MSVSYQASTLLLRYLFSAGVTEQLIGHIVVTAGAISSLLDELGVMDMLLREWCEQEWIVT